MKTNHFSIFGSPGVILRVGISALATVGSLSGANILETGTIYHVRPITMAGPAGLQDGLLENAAPSKDLSFDNESTTSYARADLTTGELKAYAGITNTIGSALALAEYSETFELRHGIGTPFEFHFTFDGEAVADGKSVAGTYIYQFYFIANFAVFEAGTADWNTWYDLAYKSNEALFADSYEFRELDQDMSSESIDESINHAFSYAGVLEGDFERFQVFSRLQMVVNASSAPQTAYFDFENTGTLGFDVAPGVTVGSGSGAFPGTVLIPEPTATLLGLLGIPIAFRRRRG